MVPRERTVWLRVIGVPVEGWREDFFYVFGSVDRKVRISR